MKDIASRGYAHPEVLVSTDWVADHANDSTVRIVESNEDTLLYRSGHIPGAVEIDWVRDLNNPLTREYLQGDAFAELMSTHGIAPETTVVLYGDKNNWWAAYAFWIFKLFNHNDVRIMDGGRVKWEQEKRPLSKDTPSYPRTKYPARDRDDSKIRVFRDAVLEHMRQRLPLIDVRSPDEFTGKKLHMENYPNEGALRGGHIPGAKNVPWARAIDPDSGVFKDSKDLSAIYRDEIGLKPSDDVVAYCRIGERSSHTWFVLTYLLGFPKVRNYDGSWTEWGNLVGVPIER